MKYVFLVSALMMLSIYTMQAQAEQKAVKEKEVIVIKKSKDGDIEKRVIKKRMDGSSMTDEQIDSLIQSIIGESGGMIEDIEMDIEKIDGEITKKIRIVTNKNGKEDIKEWETTGNSDDVFVLEMDSVEDNEERESKVKLGVMLVGTIVEDIIKDSSADKGGIRKGDKILKIDQQIIYDYRGLMNHLSSYSPRDEVQVTVKRDGIEKVLSLKLQAK